VESVYNVAEESAGISEAVIVLVEAGPVQDASATVRTSTVAEPEGVPPMTTRWIVPAKGTSTQDIADADSAVAVEVISPKVVPIVRMFWFVVGETGIAPPSWISPAVPVNCARCPLVMAPVVQFAVHPGDTPAVHATPFTLVITGGCALVWS
jgi:hypothetical protein